MLQNDPQKLSQNISKLYGNLQLFRKYVFAKKGVSNSSN